MPELTPTPAVAGVSPPVVAFLRAVGIAVVLAVLAALVSVLTGAGLTDLVEAVPEAWRPVALAVAGIVVRTLEGLGDKLRGQAPQAGPLGSAPANPLVYVDTADAGALVRTGLERLDQLAGDVPLTDLGIPVHAVDAIPRAQVEELLGKHVLTRVGRLAPHADLGELAEVLRLDVDATIATGQVPTD